MRGRAGVPVMVGESAVRVPGMRLTVLLVAGARACTAAASARDEALTRHAAALRDRLRAEADKLEVCGIAQRAHHLTFAAEMMHPDHAVAGAVAEPQAGEGPPPGDLRTAGGAAAPASDAVGPP